MPALVKPSSFRNGVWRRCPLADIALDPTLAVVLEENFTRYDDAATTGDYVTTQATSGTATISTAFPGTLLLDAGATTDNQGVQVQRLKSAFIPAANKSLWAEFHVTLTAATPPVTRAQVFVGFAASDTTVIASGAISTNNRLGWLIADGGMLVSSFTADKAGTATTGTGHTFVAATAVKLGLYFDGAADTVQPFVNGSAVGTAIPTANIPKVVVYPTLVCQSDGTDRPHLLCHGYRVVQMR